MCSGRSTGVELEHVKKWESDYLSLMEYVKNPTYGRLKCFHCLLSPAGDDPIFIGINRLIAKGLTDIKQEKNIPYPCLVVNRFECPYENINVKDEYDVGTMNSNFNAEDLFRLHKLAFIVEIALANARKGDSEIQIKDKQDLLHVPKDRNTLVKRLQQADDVLKSTEYPSEISTGQIADYIVDYFMRIRDKIALEELRFY
jgi:hypothetical protein